VASAAARESAAGSPRRTSEAARTGRIAAAGSVRARAAVEPTASARRPQKPAAKRSASVDARGRGKPGRYVVQLSAFRRRGDAEALAERLAQRGHRARVTPVQVPGQGTLYRVRLGSFSSRVDALSAKAVVERRESLVARVIPVAPGNRR
jgi:cell division septation protein DedD